jgi:hypothetical protein
MTVAEAESDVYQPVFAEMPPGPGLALLLGAQEHGQLDDFDIVEVARSARRLTSWAASLEFGAIAELSARRKAVGERLGAWDTEIGEWVADEVAAALTLSGGTAARRVVAAQQLAEDLPGTFRALADGVIDADKAMVIADGVRGAEAAVAARVEQLVLPAAPAQTCAQLRYAVRTAVIDADPDAHERRRKAAEEARRLELWDADDGTSDLAGRNLPAGAAHAASNRINAIAQAMKADGDTRTIDQLRADVYVALLRSERPETETTPRSTESPARPAAESDCADLVNRTAAHRPGNVSNHAFGEAANGATRPPGDGGPGIAPGNGAGPAAAAETDCARSVPESDTTADDADVVSGCVAELTESVGPDERERGGRTNAQRSAGRTDFAAISDLGHAEEERAVAAAVAAALGGQLTQLTGHLGRDERKLGGQAALVREAARRMKAAITDLQERWCATVTDADGTIVRHGADSYRVPARMRRALQIRDGTCRFPGCRRRADKCDADHTVPHHKGGPTCPCNLASLCRRHHRLKQRPEWQLIHIWHGVLLWIAPTGHWYITDPSS